MTTRILPVGAFVSFLREILEADPQYADLWLEGEISDLSRSAAGHVYFTLRDDDGCLKCVLFRNQALRQQQPIRFGDRVALHGGLSIYPRSGSLQLVADLVRPAGLGAAWLELEYLRQRLQAEGFFEPTRKRPLPAWPRRIGVVTSPHGAAWHDIQTVVGRRYPLAELILSPALVQGDGAPESIVAAFDALRLDADVDVVILARGGGASDDLAAFNDERVVRAVFASPVPVIAGVGHATDRTLVEDTADAFAPTPSTAAEICVPSWSHLQDQVEIQRSRLAHAFDLQTTGYAVALRSLRVRMAAASPLADISEGKASISVLSSRLSSTVQGMVERHAHQLSVRSEVLAALAPGAVLRRGYAVIRRTDSDRPVLTLDDIEEGCSVMATVQDGAFRSIVTQKRPASGISVDSRK